MEIVRSVENSEKQAESLDKVGIDLHREIHNIQVKYVPECLANPWGFLCSCGADSMNQTEHEAQGSAKFHLDYAKLFPNGPIQKGPIPCDPKTNS